jgi:hypothetical protein
MRVLVLSQVKRLSVIRETLVLLDQVTAMEITIKEHKALETRLGRNSNKYIE